MDFDFATVEEANDFVAIPPGTYRCRVEEVRTRMTQEGAELWAVRLVVAEGPYEGRLAAWDNLVWSNRAAGRVKRFLRLLGFPVDGRLTIEPHSLEGRTIRVTVKPETYHNPVTNTDVTRNRVPFDGYLEDRELKQEEAPF